MTDKLLILDIDETLVHSSILESDEYDFMVLDKYYTIKRPYVDDFLKYAFNNFTVGVFTTSTEDYATEIMKNLNVDLDKLLFLWDREKCNSLRPLYSKLCKEIG
jgi:TFIIF-interacting CTD phosphatase-like protein